MGSLISHFGLSRQYKTLKDELLDSTHLVLKSGTLVNGPYTLEFEYWLAEKTKSRYAITVHSGTQALEILARYQASNNNTITIPNITYPATLNAFINMGYQIEIHDTDNNGLLADVESNNVCRVGLYGADPYNDWKDTNNIVDGAQHWLVANGNIGLGMAVSFDPTKNLPSSGNGGAIITNNFELWQYAMEYRDNGKLTHTVVGTNSKMSEQDCAQILVRARYIDQWQDRRKQIRNYYLKELADTPVRCLSKDIINHADQKFVIYTEQRQSLYKFLLDNNIECKIHYPHTLSELPIAKHCKIHDVTTSTKLVKGLLSLPIYPELTDSEVEYIVKKVKKFFT